MTEASSQHSNFDKAVDKAFAVWEVAKDAGGYILRACLNQQERVEEILARDFGLTPEEAMHASVIGMRGAVSPNRDFAAEEAELRKIAPSIFGDEL